MVREDLRAGQTPAPARRRACRLDVLFPGDSGAFVDEGAREQMVDPEGVLHDFGDIAEFVAEYAVVGVGCCVAMLWISKALSRSRLGQVLMGASMGWRLAGAVRRVRAISWSSAGCIIVFFGGLKTGQECALWIELINPWQLSIDYI